MLRKVPVEVRAQMDEDGNIRPLAVLWEDGLWYSVDEVVALIPAIAWPFGGQGPRYEVWIDGRRTYLYYETDGHRWYMGTDKPKT